MKQRFFAALIAQSTGPRRAMPRFVPKKWESVRQLMTLDRILMDENSQSHDYSTK